MRVADLVREAASTVSAAPLKSLGTATGILLSAAAFVTTLGLASTLSDQVSSAFDQARATEVVVTSPQDASTCTSLDVANVRSLAGVEHAGYLQTAQSQNVYRPVDASQVPVSIAIEGVDAGALAAIDPAMVTGRSFDTGSVNRADPVVLLPDNLAATLGVSGIGDSIVVGNHRLSVMGTFDDVTRRPDTLNSLVVPMTTLSGLESAADRTKQKCQVVASTASGAASQVASQIALALDPGQSDSLEVVAPPDPRTFRRTLEAPVRNLALALAAGVLVIGVISVATTAAGSVSARAAEIGLRRALGARATHVAAQLTLETALIGLVGSVVGVVVGSATVAVVAAANGWAPVLDVRVAVLIGVGGAVVGALAGVVPGVRAARVPAVESLRR